MIFDTCNSIVMSANVLSPSLCDKLFKASGPEIKSVKGRPSLRSVAVACRLDSAGTWRSVGAWEFADITTFGEGIAGGGGVG